MNGASSRTAAVLSAVRPEDEDALYEFLTGPHGYRPSFFMFPLSETRIREHIRASLSAIIRDGDDLVATIGGCWNRPWFSAKMMLELLWLLVHPDYRGHKYDDALIDWFKARRDEIAAEYGQSVPIMDCVLGEERLPAKLRLWRRHGQWIGGVFLIP